MRRLALLPALAWSLAAGMFLAAGIVSPSFAQSELGSDLPQFAPGVLTTIAPEILPADTFEQHDMVEIRTQEDLQRDPNFLSTSRTLYEMADDTVFRRNVWCLEFSFKPLRMLAVDLPQPSGKMQRKLIWYLVYRVRNTGVGAVPVAREDGTIETQEKNLGDQRFVPRLFLSSFDRDRTDKPVNKTYLDRVIPSAVEAIQRREFGGRKLLNTAEIAEKVLQPELGDAVQGAWGVATWEDVDPEMDFFAIFVGGLTNAYHWEDMPNFAAGTAAGTGRTFERKMLQLNFWRPGDSFAENEREIRFGSAPGMAEYYGTREGVAYEWIYR